MKTYLNQYPRHKTPAQNQKSGLDAFDRFLLGAATIGFCALFVLMWPGKPSTAHRPRAPQANTKHASKLK